MQEEAGEVAKAIVDLKEVVNDGYPLDEYVKFNKEKLKKEIVKELTQTAAMCMRMLNAIDEGKWKI